MKIAAGASESDLTRDSRFCRESDLIRESRLARFGSGSSSLITTILRRDDESGFVLGSVATAYSPNLLALLIRPTAWWRRRGTARHCAGDERGWRTEDKNASVSSLCLQHATRRVQRSDPPCVSRPAESLCGVGTWRRGRSKRWSRR